jgi:SsrA-binding protein
LAKNKDQKVNNRPTIKNNKARYEYHIEKTFEAGIELKGSEVKSIRAANASLSESFAYMDQGEIFLKNMYIKGYEQASYFDHDEHRDRKLLLHKQEIRVIDKAIQREGMTLVPLKLYFKGPRVKIEIGLAKGKKNYDKRASIAERDTNRQLGRELKRFQ